MRCAQARAGVAVIGPVDGRDSRAHRRRRSRLPRGQVASGSRRERGTTRDGDARTIRHRACIGAGDAHSRAGCSIRTTELNADHVDEMPGSAGFPTSSSIGAMKSGTSSLHEYLDLAARRLHEPTEGTGVLRSGTVRVAQRGVVRADSSRRSRLARHRGEASPHYSIRHVYPGVVERMHARAARTRASSTSCAIRSNASAPNGCITSHAAASTVRSRRRCASPKRASCSRRAATAWQLEPYFEHYGASTACLCSRASS